MGQRFACAEIAGDESPSRKDRCLMHNREATGGSIHYTSQDSNDPVL